MESNFFNDLPDEIIEKVFDFVSIDTIDVLLHLSHTCRKWRQILISNRFYNRIVTFENISRYLLYRFPSENDQQDQLFQRILRTESDQSRPCMHIDSSRNALKQHIQNCPLIDLSVTFWCESIRTHIIGGMILILWHYHLGYMGLSIKIEDQIPVIQCTYTQSYEVKLDYDADLEKWTHFGIVVDLTRGLQVYINGDRVSSCPLQSPSEKQNYSPVPHSTVWFGSNNGGNCWNGSLFDVAIWNRCLKPYEIRAMAKKRISLNDVDFLPDFFEEKPQ